MSYRDPKYINKSVQGSFDKLQSQINTTVTQVKEREYQEKLAEDARKNAITLAGDQASQSQTLLQSKSNTFGDENTLGTVGTFFQDYPKRAAEITTEMAKKPRPENYYELEAELQMIEDSPENMKNGLTNLESQLTIDNLNNIDPHQSPGLLLASQVFNNTSGYTEANGYTMGLEKNLKDGREDGTFNYIFKFDPDVARANLIKEQRWDPDTNTRVDYTDEELEAKLKGMEYPDETFQLNSGALKNMQANNKSLITEIGHMNKSVNEALVTTNIIAGGEFGDDGEWKSGSGTFDINKYGMEGDQEGTDFEYIKDGDVRYKLKKIDRAKVETGMGTAINTQIASYLDPLAGDDAGARGLWNMRLRTKTDATVFDEEEARDAFGIAEGVEFDVEKLKKRWTKAAEAWGYDGPISDDQRAIFKKLYTDHIVDDTVRKMEQTDMVNNRYAKEAGTKMKFPPIQIGGKK